MDKKFKGNKIKNSTFGEEDFTNNDEDSAIENNKNDLASNQGSSGIKDINMVEKISKIEEEYLIRSERFDRDEENPMYDDSHQTGGVPDKF